MRRNARMSIILRCMQGEQHCYVATDGASQGFMSLEDDGHLDMAYVAPALRGTGLSTQLYAAVLGLAHAKRLEHLYTEASRLARPFFERQGWKADAEERVERNGVFIPRFRMSLSLKD